MTNNTARPDGRSPQALRKISLERNYTKHAEGSVMVRFGDTHVLCTCSVEDKVPGFLKGKGSRFQLFGDTGKAFASFP